MTEIAKSASDAAQVAQRGPGRIVAIWVKRAHHGAMDARERARLVEGLGIEGNADQEGSRQVTLIGTHAWEEMTAELGASVPPIARRANLLVSGIDLRASRGGALRIGSCLLEIRGETKPCERMDEAAAGLRSVMAKDWRGGVYARVIAGGEITVGDPVWLADPGDSR